MKQFLLNYNLNKIENVFPSAVIQRMYLLFVWHSVRISSFIFSSSHLSHEINPCGRHTVFPTINLESTTERILTSTTSHYSTLEVRLSPCRWDTHGRSKLFCNSNLVETCIYLLSSDRRENIVHWLNTRPSLLVKPGNYHRTYVLTSPPTHPSIWWASKFSFGLLRTNIDNSSVGGVILESNSPLCSWFIW
jgi:hypothetical protein